ncbi:transcriptional regulator, TetR family [Massilia sp. PDC64]|nr:transcriptional regulator, TetR family [Massilia sp. PDC64]
MSTRVQSCYSSRMKQPKKAGRPAGDQNNRDKIMAVARAHFAAHGFRGATLRGIAGDAGLDVALIAHYFKNKEGLFAATLLQLPAGVDQMFAQALTGPRATQGDRLARAYFGLWESEETRSQLQVLVRTALGSEAAALQMRELLVGQILEGLRRTGVLDGRQTGFALAMSHLLGTAVARYVIGVPVLAELGFETLVGRVGPVVQGYLELEDGGLA